MKNSIGSRQPFGYNANGRVESCNATGEEESVDPLLSSLDNSRLTQLGSFISTDQVDIFQTFLSAGCVLLSVMILDG